MSSMHKLAFILGRTPLLAKKEIEALAATILPFQWSGSMVQSGIFLLKPEPDGTVVDMLESGSVSSSIQKLQVRLGSVPSIIVIEREVPEAALEKALGEYIRVAAPEMGRLTFGISIYGKGNPGRIGLDLRRSLKSSGLSVRFVASTQGNVLTAAQVIHNGLTKDKGIEAVAIYSGNSWLIGRTVAIQDIAAYRKRDFGIPFPDPVSGMLSPKLAQAMLNLAAGEGLGEKTLVYDPFCGNGRILSEARLMGFSSIGSDISQDQVKASQGNLAWMTREFDLAPGISPTEAVWTQDATQKSAVALVKPFAENAQEWHIVTEPYLGKPLRDPLRPNEVGPWADELSRVYMGFFEVWAQADVKPKSMIVVFPAAKVQGVSTEHSIYSDLVDRLSKIGYCCLQVSDYGRPDALVKRQVVRVTYSE